MNNIHCICTTPDVFPVYVNNWNNFPKDNKELIWLSDITRDPSFEVGFKFTEQDIRKEFNFNIEVSKQNFWNAYGRNAKFCIINKAPRTKQRSLYSIFTHMY